MRDGNDLVIWSDVDRTEEVTRFSYPRASKDPWLCIADFFRPVDSGEIDYVAFMIVTMGHTVSERTAKRDWAYARAWLFREIARRRS